MSEILSREQTDRRAPDAVQVRRLAYSDLPGVISIERRSFPTPWSLAMFVLELSKPSGICLAATRGDELAGYVVCSRYDQVWHLMNVAVSPDHRADGVAGALMRRLFEEGRRRAPLHARGPRLQPPRDRHVRTLRLPLGRRPSPLLPRQRRGRADHVAGLRWLDSGPRRAPRDRDVLRRHLRRRARGRGIRSNVISSQAAAHAGFGGVVPEVAARHHLELAAPVVEAALAEAGVTLDDIEAVAATAGPGLIGALLVGISTAKAIAAARRLPLIPVDHLQGHVAANFLEPEPLEPPFLCLVASGGHTLLAAVRDHGGHEVLGQTLDDAAGEAFDKSARLLGLGYPGGPLIQKEAEEGDPEAFEMPVAMSRDPGLDFSFSGLKTALVYRCRELGREGVEERRADLAASFQKAVVDQLVAKLRAGAEEGRLGGGRAGRRRRRQRAAARGGRRALRARRGAAEAGPDHPLHRQRGDDRLRRPLGDAGRLSRLPWLRRLRHRRADGGVNEAVAAAGRPTEVVVYSRPGAISAREAIEALVALHEEGYRFEMHEIDIESDDLLLRRHLERIPVVEVDGIVASELILDEAAVRARLDTVGAWPT